MKTITRRNFIKQSALAAAAASFTARSWAQVPGSNEDIRVAVIGFNGRGANHISELQELRKKGKNVRVVALCDADKNVLEKAAKVFRDRQEPIETYVDIRKLLEDKNIDAISTATPNHWHALASVWSIQAGKDVYVEKPVSHNVWEGRKIVEAARKYNRIVQTGTQSRSNLGLREAMAWLHEGNLGKVKLARGLCYKRRKSIGKVSEPQRIPESIDYDLWCGPAPKTPLMRKNLHYDWHWVWPTGSGDLGNQGIHQMDIARWALGVDALSPKVFSAGGRFGYIDDGETPNTQFVIHDYPQAPLIFEVRGLPSGKDSEKMDKYRGADIGVIIDCEQGYMMVPSYSSATAFAPDGKVLKKFEGGASHFENFLGAVRSRKYQALNADILEGHLSSALCHTGNISYRLGREMPADEILEKIHGEKEALETFERMAEHLAANGVNLHESKPTLGMFLKMDPKTERFIDNAKANELLTREYRKPFVVPAKV